MTKSNDTPINLMTYVSAKNIRRRLRSDQRLQWDSLAPHALEDLVELAQEEGLEDLLQHWELYYLQSTQY